MGFFQGSMAYDYTGRKRKRTTKSSKRTIRAVSKSPAEPYRRETPEYRSAPDTTGVAVRVEPPRYTGTLVKGIGTMHKSNAIPILDEQQMKDLASMRR